MEIAPFDALEQTNIVNLIKADATLLRLSFKLSPTGHHQ